MVAAFFLIILKNKNKMANCNKIKGVPYTCDDNNVGSIRTAWIADYRDVASYTEDMSGGTIATIVMNSGATFQEFTFKKNTSSYAENWAGDLTADVHLWTQDIIIGLRRIEISKRNAISVLAEGRRRLVVITLDNNGEYRVFGLDDGLRLSAMESGTNAERAAGTFYTITLTGEEKFMGLYTDKTLVDTLI